MIKHHNGGPTVNTKVTYDPAIVQNLAPKRAKTFHDYTHTHTKKTTTKENHPLHIP